MNQTTLGIDVGSVSVSLVRLRADRTIAETRYVPHGGKVRDCLSSLLNELEIDTPESIGITSASAGLIPDATPVDTTVSFATAARVLHPDLRTLLIVGGERFARILFSPDGRYTRMWRNTSCAAGTGSFLDQQARRLGLSDSGALSRLATENRGSVPIIASRCSVFAKTDIIHAQQEGYSLEEICDGLCQGLARNLLDTLAAEAEIPEPALFAGGVARNNAVLHHLCRLSGSSITTDRWAHLYGALGAAFVVQERQSQAGEQIEAKIWKVNELIPPSSNSRTYEHEPLVFGDNGYPDFTSGIRSLFNARTLGSGNPVEVEEFAPACRERTREVYFGIDIGSTSTKAVAMDGDHRVIAGFYTRTAGQPLLAVQAIFEAAEEFPFRVLGSGTTGAGRRFIGSIVGADLVVDEITAHARAACELDPETDTIIEIGGQDAKFTTLRKGVVTFSHMNTVCAAGTGSFLEEQAARLSTSLSEYSDLAVGVASPLASDRCTVFMERDINHLLQQGYERRELLAAALHSVRENYLQKVAGGAAIGKRICFQGATARNRALVSAFEQRIGRSISVSRYCHLTGALGVALLLSESPPADTAFFGFGLHRQDIGIRSERCSLCANRCRLRVASVGSAEVAYGFLCGRDYETQHFVDRNRSGFSLLRSRARVQREVLGALQGESPPTQSAGLSVGIPASLHLFGEIPFWRLFFGRLGFTVVGGEAADDPVGRGKALFSAEFCTPMRDLFGQSTWLLDHADYVFVPFALRNRDSGKNNCYYTQFAPALLKSAAERANGTGRIISPLISSGPNALRDLAPALARDLTEIAGRKIKDAEVLAALHFADHGLSLTRTKMKEILESRVAVHERAPAADISVMLLGRPYTVLSPILNKRIPEIFGEQGVPVFFQDMIPDDSDDEEEKFLSLFPWHHASEALRSAQYCARTPHIYPVYISSFRCSPDSFALEYFRKIMDASAKPYLVLQLDEHDSTLGYETRVEAAVHAFRNHNSKPSSAGPDAPRPAGPLRQPLHPPSRKDLRRKTILLPNWNTFATPLLAATLQRRGYDARVLRETPELIRKSMVHNSGQCIPVNAIAEETAEYIRAHRLDPAKTILWTLQSEWACNIPLYPQFIQTLLRSFGKGLEQVAIYPGLSTFEDIAPTLPVDVYFAYLFGGMLARLTCRIRPYELNPGMTDRAVKEAFSTLVRCFEGKMRRARAVRIVEDLFRSIPFDSSAERPKVAIFGDLYVRDNTVFNQDLVRTIERAGGEAIVTSYNDYAKIIASPMFSRLKKNGELVSFARYRILLGLLQTLERLYMQGVTPLVGPVYPYVNRDAEKQLGMFHLRLEHEGESAENVLKVLHLLERYPDISLFVQVSPAFCCPALVTEAMTEDIERITGIPVLSITYDGTCADGTGSGGNDVIFPQLALQLGRPSRPAGVSE